MKQLTEKQEGYIKGILDSKKTFREAQTLFFAKYKRNLSLNTIERISNRSKKIKREINDFSRKTTEREVRIILRVIRQNRNSSWEKLQQILQDDHDLNISQRSLRRRAKENGISSFIPKKTFLLSKKHAERRKAFARKYMNENADFWNNVIFSDETKISLFYPDCGNLYLKGTKESMQKKPECKKQFMKHGGGNIKLWSNFSSKGVGEIIVIKEKLTGRLYAEILENNLRQDASKMEIETDFKFLHDNDPKHTSNIAKNWILNNGIEMIAPWPANSPDLNPIENLWSILKKKVGLRKPRNLLELELFVKEEWAQLGQENILLHNLAYSMPDRLAELKEAKGYHTSY